MNIIIFAKTEILNTCLYRQLNRFTSFFFWLATDQSPDRGSSFDWPPLTIYLIGEALLIGCSPVTWQSELFWFATHPSPDRASCFDWPPTNRSPKKASCLDWPLTDHLTERALLIRHSPVTWQGKLFWLATNQPITKESELSWLATHWSPDRASSFDWLLAGQLTLQAALIGHSPTRMRTRSSAGRGGRWRAPAGRGGAGGGRAGTGYGARRSTRAHAAEAAARLDKGQAENIVLWYINIHSCFEYTTEQ